MEELVVTRDVAEFARQTRGFLGARPERNVAATVLDGVESGRYAGSGPLFAYARDGRGQVTLAVLRTPPWPLLVSDLDPGIAPALLDHWLAADPEPPGVSGVPAAAQAVAAAWRARTGGQTQRRMRTLLHALERVVDPAHPAPGSLRLAQPEERGLLVRWNEAFEREADVVVSGQAEALVDERLRSRGWLVWDDEGPMSLVGVNPPVAGTVRIGPVYTPPEHRNHGYATTAVAAASRRALAEGATTCMLYTDVANPTSNRIYAQVGYRPIGGWEEHSFGTPSSGDP